MGRAQALAWRLRTEALTAPGDPMRGFVPLVDIGGWELGTVPGGVGVRRRWTF